MRYIYLFLLILPLNLKAQTSVEVIKWTDMEVMLSQKSDVDRVFNFWATWCRPCIKEIPYFEEVYAEKQSMGMELYLISLDDVENVEKRVIPFVERRGLKATILLLDETDYNAFIDKVHPSWSGAIPATLFLSKEGEKNFYEGEMNKEELTLKIEKYFQL
ncbi:MAG: TlpA family protein disulfide reductase [Cyclobacteriaceae bacterium]|nr:TlpA family protein disulfide reductase [Cyclobacteriaceae bacterium]MCH8516122.1 TlpA family protein disulfide reductase [Cyclobacteriaceae bacterium]